jgi:predicted lipid-binding transport protein (Tim44 family)
MERSQSFLSESVRKELAVALLDLERLGQNNYVEKIQFTKISTAESWQEHAQEFVAVHFEGSRIVYSRDRAAGNIVEGDSEKPLAMDEIWVFSRFVSGHGKSPWIVAEIRRDQEGKVRPRVAS